MVSSCGSSQVRVRTLWPIRAAMRPGGAAGGLFLTRWVAVFVQGPLDSWTERSAFVVAGPHLDLVAVARRQVVERERSHAAEGIEVPSLRFVVISVG